jgi:hypothetical protein
MKRKPRLTKRQRKMVERVDRWLAEERRKQREAEERERPFNEGMRKLVAALDARGQREPLPDVGSWAMTDEELKAV